MLSWKPVAPVTNARPISDSSVDSTSRCAGVQPKPGDHVSAHCCFSSKRTRRNTKQQGDT